MRDEVFRVERGPNREGDHAVVRTVEIEGEPWWLMTDLLLVRGWPYHRAFQAELLTHVPEDASERIWLLDDRSESPRAMWVVSAEGASVVHDVLAARPRREPRRRKRGIGPRRPTAPGFIAGAIRTNEEN
ncbi:hypothetical protein [Streptomyces sp. DH1]|uniref:hypothetical protein n=1 Tax=Streptomyces sp. DH1 TaxID=2857012 RepID=UPI001E5BF724|nr:hypothetical protein [Streptomyces sp. DH1]